MRKDVFFPAGLEETSFLKMAGETQGGKMVNSGNWSTSSPKTQCVTFQMLMVKAASPTPTVPVPDQALCSALHMFAFNPARGPGAGSRADLILQKMTQVPGRQ